MDTTPYAIILLYLVAGGDKELLSLTQVSGIYMPSSLWRTEDILKRAVIRENSVDMVVTCARAMYSHCYFFDTIFPSMSFRSGKKYILRDFNTHQDFPLNRCSEDQVPFCPTCFQLGKPTPGRRNDCTGTSFVLEHEIDAGKLSLSSSLLQNEDRFLPGMDTNEEIECDASFPNIAQADYETLNYTFVLEAVQEAMETAECQRKDRYPTNPVSVNENREEGEAPEAPKFNEFNEADFNACKAYLSNPSGLLIPSIKIWIEMTRQPGECRFFCKACREYIRMGFRPDYKRRSNLQKDKGYYSKDSDTNSDVIKRHSTNGFHKEALLYYQKIKAANSVTEIQEINKNQAAIEMEILKPTMNAIHIAYLQLKTNGTFRSNPIFMGGIQSLGVQLGFKHRNPGALRNMMSVMSNEMHFRLLKHLVNHGTYFSFIVDGTTNAAIIYLVCLIQTLESKNPVVYLWALIPLSKSGGSEKVVEDVVKRIDEDNLKVPGFSEYFKTKLIALSSDSANDMVGVHNSFYTHLQSYVGNSIVSIKCGSHKLHRVLFHAIDIVTKPNSDPKKKGDSFFESFERSTNQFYTFYLSRGSKRWQRITDLGKEIGVVPYRLKKFFDLRWASSELKCLQALDHDYDLLREDLESIKTDKSFNSDGQKKASELSLVLSDKTFAVTVAEFIDMLAVLKKMSVRFQKKAGLMIGNVEIVRQGVAELSNLRVSPGDKLNDFLQSCECDNVCAKGHCTLQNYDDCHTVIRNGKYLNVTQDHGVKLSDYRDIIYFKLLEGMQDYFSPITLEAFDLFNNKLFNFECNATGLVTSLVCSELDYCYSNVLSIDPDSSAEKPSKKLKRLCDYYFYTSTECDALHQDWKFALSGIVINSECRIRRSLDAGLFWPDTLQRDEIPMTSMLHSFIVKVLVSGWTSADAERAFSQVTHMKSPDRSSMTSETLEQLVRLKFNGPDTLSRQSAYHYTKTFVTRYSRVDDKDTRGGRRTQNEDESNEFYFSRSKLF